MEQFENDDDDNNDSDNVEDVSVPDRAFHAVFAGGKPYSRRNLFESTG